MSLKVVVFGSAGLLGQDLVKRKPSNTELIAHVHSDCDIRDLSQVKKILEADKPDWVINSVAYNNVDGAETNFEQALDLNSKAPKNLAHVCASLGIILIHVSTDYVFQSRNSGFFSEEESPEPINRYGISKCEGEENVRVWEKHYILRTSSLYGMGRVNHASRVIEALETKKPFNVSDDIYCSPTYTGDLATWIYELIFKKPEFGTYHLCHVGLVTRFEFAERLCEIYHGSKSDLIQPIATKSLNLLAKRPVRPALSMKKWEKNVGPLRTWEEGIQNYLSERKSKI